MFGLRARLRSHDGRLDFARAKSRGGSICEHSTRHLRCASFLEPVSRERLPALAGLSPKLAFTSPLALLMSISVPWRALSLAITLPMSLMSSAPSFRLDRSRSRPAISASLTSARQEFLDHRKLGAFDCRPVPRGRPASYISINSRRCLAIFCSTSITSASSSCRRLAGAQLDIAVLDLGAGSGGTAASAVLCRRPSSR